MRQVKLLTATTLFDIVFLAVVSTALYLAFIHSYALLAPDEGRYAGIAEAMLRGHHWITPKQDGVPFLDKPILFYWLEIFAMRHFGINALAARLVPLSFGVFGVLTTYLGGRAMFNRRTGLTAALIVMTSPLYFFEAHYVNMDIMVAVLISASLWSFIIGIQPHARFRRTLMILAYVFAGLAILTKGLMGIVFPMIIIGTWMLCLHEWRQLKRMMIPAGIIIILLINLPWFTLIQKQNPNFYHYFFITQQFQRYLTQQFNMHYGLYFYPLIIIAGMLPWSVFLPQTLIASIKTLKHFRTSNVTWFLSLWVVLILIFFSIPASKIASYILPVFSPIAVLIARYLDQHWPRLYEKISTRLSLWALALLVIALIIAAIVFIFKKPYLANDAIFYLTAVATFLGVVVILIWRLSWFKAGFRRLFFALLLSSTVVYLSVFPALHWFIPQTGKQLAVAIQKHITPATKVVAYQTYLQDVPFYLKQNIYVVQDHWHDPNILHKDNWKSELVKGAMQSGNWQYLIDPQQLKSLLASGQPVIIFMKQDDFSRFKQQMDDHDLSPKTVGHYIIVKP